MSEISEGRKWGISRKQVTEELIIKMIPSWQKRRGDGVETDRVEIVRPRRKPVLTVLARDSRDRPCH